MNDFKGLSRDTSVIKTPEQMWQFARNILLTNKYLSVTNEKGNEYGYEIPGVVVGYIITNDDIVYLSVDGNYSCIGYVNQYNQVYTPVLRTTNPNFKFKLNCPIEGVYVYNYKKELVIVFSDGVNQDSSTPKLINLHNPQVQLSPTKEFINSDDYVMFELFNYTELPSSNFEYEKGSFDAEVVHLAFCYVFDDNTDALYSPIIETCYPNLKGYNTIYRNIKFNLSNLSSKFKKIKLAFIIKKDAGTFAYTTPILSIIDNKLEYILSTEEELTAITPEEIVITPERFTKIKTITKTANQIEVGNVEIPKQEDLQKYANLLTLEITPIIDINNKYATHPTFLPDEVYAFSVIPIYTDGTKGLALHIPGRKGTPEEKAVLTDAEIKNYNLNYSEFLGKGYKSFHFNNTGTISDNSATFGYWENESLYPDKDRYNSSSLGGEDLRGTPIRYHRFPSLDNIDATSVFNNNSVIIGGLDTKTASFSSIGKTIRFNLKLINFNDVFPEEIRKQLQGYEVVFEKRQRGGTYIEQHGLLYNYNYPDGTTVIRDTPDGKKTYVISSNPLSFGKTLFFNADILENKVNINSNLLKVYNSVNIRKFNNFISNGAPPFYVKGILKDKKDRFAKITKAEYLLADNIIQQNSYQEENLSLQLTNSASFLFTPLQTSDKVFNMLQVGLLTLNKNLYNLEYNTSFISVGTVLFKDYYLYDNPLTNGDVFVSSIIDKNFTRSDKLNIKKINYDCFSYLLGSILNLYSTSSNAYIINGNTLAENRVVELVDVATTPILGIDVFSVNVYVTWKTEDVNVLNSNDYTTVIKSKKAVYYFNDYINSIPPALIENFINYFPYRVYKGLAIPNESLQTKNLRFFPTNSYYDMRNDRGEIIALRGYNRGLYIQQRYSLFESYIADKLNATAEETYLGSSELFDRIPEEILYNDNIGYIGSNSQFACIIFRDGYATVDEEQGKVFIVNKGLSEISQQNLKNYFRQALPLGNKYTKKDLLGNTVKVDNPFSSIGYLIGFDEEYNRLILTKKYYTPKNNTINLDFDGEFYYDERNRKIDFDNESYFINESKTFSFALDSKTWVCEHDYFPNAYFYNNKGFFLSKSVIGGNTKIYKHNSNKVNPGNFFGKQYQSYVDLIFNGRLDISKQYQALNWVSESFDIATNTELQFDTIDKVMFYNNHQCSGYIEVSKTDLKTSRNAEGIWQLNEFRDMLISPDKKILNDDGSLITNNISLEKQWFNKGMFFGNFIVVRMLWDNTTKVLKHIHNVNVKSVLSQR